MLTGRVKEKELPAAADRAAANVINGCEERRMKNDQPAVMPLATNVYRTPA